MKSGTARRSVVPAKAGTQYAAGHRERTEYWIPALASLGRDDKPTLKVTP
jgi:hypothetical protein